MAMPGSGPISLYQANIELGRPGSQAISLNDGGLRALSGRTSGYSDMYSLYGKSSVSVSASVNQTDITAGGGNRRTQNVVSLNITGGTASSYAWSYDGSIGETLVGGTTGATLTLRGPTYATLSTTYYQSSYAHYSVVVNGVTYSGDVQLDYQVQEGV